MGFLRMRALMGVKVMVELPEELAQRARAVAAQNGRPFEATLVELIGRAVAEPDVDLLPDDQIVALCDSTMEAPHQEELSELLDRNREGSIQPRERSRLDELMQVYRRGLVRKAQAWRTAVARGLKPQLADDLPLRQPLESRFGLLGQARVVQAPG